MIGTPPIQNGDVPVPLKILVLIGIYGGLMGSDLCNGIFHGKVPSGKLLHKYGQIHHAITVKSHINGHVQ